MNNWRHALDDAFSEMATVMPDLLQNKLGQYLAPGQRWTDILMVLDQEHRRVDPKWYREGDPRIQLRMITERLGNIGYPFDDSTRETSARGQMLRLVANDFAHWEDLTAFEVLRVFDDIEHVLERVGDDRAHQILAHLRQSTGLAGLLIEPELELPPTETPSADTESFLSDEESTLTEQAAQVDRSSAQGSTPELASALGSERQPYQPYRVVQQGHQEDLKERLGPARKQKVHAVIQDVVSSQWPIMLTPLARQVGRSFGYQRVPEKPRKKVENQVPLLAAEGLLHISPDDAVWPSRDEEQSWHGFRPDPLKHRKYDEIPAREIRNAAKALLKNDNGSTPLDVVRLVAAEFGFTRLTSGIRTYFGTALEGSTSK